MRQHRAERRGGSYSEPDDPEGGVRGPPDEGEGDGGVVVEAGNLEYLQSHVVDRNSLLSTCCDQKIWTRRSLNNTVVGAYMPGTIILMIWRNNSKLSMRERWRSSQAKMANDCIASRVRISSVADRSAESGAASVEKRRHWISWRGPRHTGGRTKG